MLAVEYHSNDDVRIVDLPIPEIGSGEIPVSYTHLTLPTIYSV